MPVQGVSPTLSTEEVESFDEYHVRHLPLYLPEDADLALAESKKWLDIEGKLPAPMAYSVRVICGTAHFKLAVAETDVKNVFEHLTKAREHFVHAEKRRSVRDSRVVNLKAKDSSGQRISEQERIELECGTYLTDHRAGMAATLAFLGSLTDNRDDLLRAILLARDALEDDSHNRLALTAQGQAHEALNRLPPSARPREASENLKGVSNDQPQHFTPRMGLADYVMAAVVAAIVYGLYKLYTIIM